MPDWKKEIKLSDLFKRGEKPPKAEKPTAPAKVEAAAEPAGERKRFFKKELSFGRRPKEPKAATEAEPAAERKSRFKKELSFGRRRKEPKAPKEAGAPKTRRRRERGAGKSAVPAGVPLMRAFNLLPRQDSREAAGRRPSTARLILAVVALVALGALGSMFLLTGASVSDKRRQYDDLRQELAQLSVPVEEPVEEANPELVTEKQARTGALASALSSRIAWDRLLRDFSLVLPEDVWLTSILASGAPKADPAAAAAPGEAAKTSSFTVNGYAHEQDGVARLLARLAVLPELEGVQLLSSTRTQIGKQDVVQFSIAATVKTGTGATA